MNLGIKQNITKIWDTFYINPLVDDSTITIVEAERCKKSKDIDLKHFEIFNDAETYYLYENNFLKGAADRYAYDKICKKPEEYKKIKFPKTKK